MNMEYSVVWRWRRDDALFPFTPMRRKVFKTERGARRLIAKLTSNGGRYDKLAESDERYDTGLTIEKLTLDYAQLEERETGPWTVCNAMRGDS